MKAINPLTGSVCTSGYGRRMLLGSEQFHPGIDLAPRTKNEKIICPLDGLIVAIGLSSTFGNRVWIKSDTREYYVLAHMREITTILTAGFKIYQGQEIGIVGNTGLSHGVHTHWEFRKDLQANSTAFDSSHFYEIEYYGKG
jgi:murein DD-endopeptidase MepM/ murein hydrolase activator NlpD